MNILCSIFNHKYKIKRVITPQVRELVCTRCKREFAMNDNVHALHPMSERFRILHDALISVSND